MQSVKAERKWGHLCQEALQWGQQTIKEVALSHPHQVRPWTSELGQTKNTPGTQPEHLQLAYNKKFCLVVALVTNYIQSRSVFCHQH